MQDRTSQCNRGKSKNGRPAQKQRGILNGSSTERCQLCFAEKSQ
jgi:hypothetical protein